MASVGCGPQVLTSELFGLQHFASNHAMMHLAPTIGGLLMSATLAGNVYSVRGRAHDDPAGSCFGGDCYRRVLHKPLSDVPWLSPAAQSCKAFRYCTSLCASRSGVCRQAGPHCPCVGKALSLAQSAMMQVAKYMLLVQGKLSGDSSSSGGADSGIGLAVSADSSSLQDRVSAAQEV